MAFDYPQKLAQYPFLSFPSLYLLEIQSAPVLIPHVGSSRTVSGVTVSGLGNWLLHMVCGLHPSGFSLSFDMDFRNLDLLGLCSEVLRLLPLAYGSCTSDGSSIFRQSNEFFRAIQAINISVSFRLSCHWFIFLKSLETFIVTSVCSNIGIKRKENNQGKPVVNNIFYSFWQTIWESFNFPRGFHVAVSFLEQQTKLLKDSHYTT